MTLNLKTDSIRQLLTALGAIGIGEFRDGNLKEWRLTTGE